MCVGFPDMYKVVTSQPVKTKHGGTKTLTNCRKGKNRGFEALFPLYCGGLRLLK